MNRIIIISILTIILFGCVTDKKAYKRVQQDTDISTKEKQIILEKAILLAPDLKDTPILKSTVIDSAEYNATINAYLDVITQLNKQLEYHQDDDVWFVPEGTTDSFRVQYRVSKKDSLRIIKNFLLYFKPPAIKEIITKEIPTTDGKRLAQIQLLLNNCEASNIRLVNDQGALKQKLEKRNKRTGWFIAGGIAALVIAFITGWVTKKTLV